MAAKKPTKAKPAPQLRAYRAGYTHAEAMLRTFELMSKRDRRTYLKGWAASWQRAVDGAAERKRDGKRKGA